MKSISRPLLLILFLSATLFSYAQEEIIIEPDTIMPNSDSAVFVFVEDQPTFPGGDEARIKYLQENIKYPEKAKERGIQGTVYVSFVIEKDGRITNVKCLKGPGGGLNKEAIRVVKSMPNWKPGLSKGKAVRCQFNMPLRFILENDGPTEKIPTKKELKALKKKVKQEAKVKKKAANNTK